MLIGIFLLFDFSAGIYHTTHGGGWVSGSIELFFGFVISGLVYLYWTKQGRWSQGSLDRYRITLTGIAGAIALTLLYFSVYHFTHQGLRSGIIELMLSGLIITCQWLAGFKCHSQ